MNDLSKTTLTSMEVAQMVDKRHCDLMRDIRKYCEHLGESKIAFSDFFTESTYTTEQNKTVACFLVTKKGCEFIAHKLTGQKGTEFTARYINRFHEMENQVKQIPLTDRPDRVAQLINAVSPLMKRNESTPYDIVSNARLICEQYGIKLIDNFAKVPEYKQMELFDYKKEVTE